MEVKKIINQLFCWPTDESSFRRKVKLAYDLMEMAKHDSSPTIIVDAIIDKLSNNKIY